MEGEGEEEGEREEGSGQTGVGEKYATLEHWAWCMREQIEY